jgi:hypothetical protein
VAQEAAQAVAAQAALAVEQAEQPETLEPRAAAIVLLNPPVAKAVRVATLRPSPPAARARIASIPQALELDRDQPGPASGRQAAAQADRDSDKRYERYRQRTRAAPHPFGRSNGTSETPPGGRSGRGFERRVPGELR